MPDRRHRISPPARVAAVLACVLLAAALVLAGCGSGTRNPFATFATRCAQLPPPRFSVTQVPVTYVEDDSQTIASLSARSGATPATHRTIGLTVARLGYEASIGLRSVSENGGRTCGTPDISVELSLQPMIVYVAREFADSRCERDATLEHEMKHVAVHTAMLDEAAAALRDELPKAIGTSLRTAAHASELEQSLNGTVRGFLSDFIHERHRVLADGQAQVDTREEYERLAKHCG